jgi:hypothetical protein
MQIAHFERSCFEINERISGWAWMPLVVLSRDDAKVAILLPRSRYTRFGQFRQRSR